MADYLPQLFLAWSIQLMGVVSPGPGVALILGVATSRGRMPSLVTSFGIACASVVLALGTVLGIATIFAQMAELMTLVRIIGAAYLAWLAYKAFRSATEKHELTIAPVAKISVWRTALTGFFLQLSNPKAIMFWLAIASVGGVGDAPASVIVLFVLGAFVNSFIGHGGYALILSSKPVRLLYARARRWIDIGLGGFFSFASYKLATSQS